MLVGEGEGEGEGERERGREGERERGREREREGVQGVPVPAHSEPATTLIICTLAVVTTSSDLSV